MDMHHSSRMRKGGSIPTPSLQNYKFMTEKQELFLEMLTQSVGVLSSALTKSGVSREEYDNWILNMTFKKEVERINEMSIDFVENQLMRKINEGDLAAIQFYLKTKGKKRGY